MSYDQAVDGLRLLTEIDLPTAAGGYQPNLPGKGGGGPTEIEARIEDMFEHWPAAVSGGGEWTSYMADDAMFLDRDQNDYYDYVEISGDGGVWVYDGATDSWTFRAYDDNQAS
ncbi:MAG: hypothetical protein QOJ91_2616 [Sphingomonadales bacterium]|jgi:hypothetical protein|nr:hypothetical protein [Sphingomonadales bacterium]